MKIQLKFEYETFNEEEKELVFPVKTRKNRARKKEITEELLTARALEVNTRCTGMLFSNPTLSRPHH